VERREGRDRVGEVLVRIRREGIGIAPNLQPHIFGRGQIA
jgi:hypothetical protein